MEFTAREIEVMQALADRGFCREAAAKALFIEANTIKSHLVHIFQKTNTNNLAAAYAVGVRVGVWL